MHNCVCHHHKGSLVWAPAILLVSLAVSGLLDIAFAELQNARGGDGMGGIFRAGLGLRCALLGALSRRGGMYPRKDTLRARQPLLWAEVQQEQTVRTLLVAHVLRIWKQKDVQEGSWQPLGLFCSYANNGGAAQIGTAGEGASSCTGIPAPAVSPVITPC